MKMFFSMVMILSASMVMSQSKNYITNIPDTSFNTEKDFRQNIKKFPFIEIARDVSIAQVKEFRNLVYCKEDSRELHADVFLPGKSKKRTPAILIIHGGGWRSGNRSQHIPLAQRLAALGYACFTIEYRLSTEALYPTAVNDVKSAVQWIRANAKRFNVDANEIAALGFSAGGHLAALVGVTNGLEKFDVNRCNEKYASNVNAVIDIDGTLSFVHGESWETQNQNDVRASAWWLGYKRTERIDVWTEASPLTYAASNTVPFLFLNSAVERMHAGRDDFKKLMDEKNVHVEIVTFEGAPHAFCLYHPWFDPMVKHIDDFLKFVFDSSAKNKMVK